MYNLKADAIEMEIVDHYLVYTIWKINAWRWKKKERKFIEISQHEKYEKVCLRIDVQQIDLESILSPFEGDPEFLNQS